MSETFNLFDLIFLAVTFILAFIAFFRGFIKEFFALITWIIAIALSYFIAPFLADVLAKYSDHKVAIYASSRVIIFVAVFFIIAISTSEFIKDLKEKIPSSFDKSFGVLFGIGKSILIFAIIYSAIANTTLLLISKQSPAIQKTAKMPSFLTEAKCGNVLKIPAESFDPLMKKFVQAIADNFYNSSSAPENLDKKTNEVIKGDAKQKPEKDPYKQEMDEMMNDVGYKKKDIEKMNRLMDIISK